MAGKKRGAPVKYRVKATKENARLMLALVERLAAGGQPSEVELADLREFLAAAAGRLPTAHALDLCDQRRRVAPKHRRASRLRPMMDEANQLAGPRAEQA